jgi:hypothetical protein
MNVENNLENNPCKSGCDFQVDDLGSASCVSGGDTCMVAGLLEAEESDLHDITLIQATQSINEILSGIPADSEGRNLSFLKTNMGVLLAWVAHGETAIEGAVTASDDDETVSDALKLIS